MNPHEPLTALLWMFGRRLDAGHIFKASRLLSSPRFGSWVQETINHWPQASSYFMERGPWNPVPWAGRLTCGLHAEATIRETTAAYVALTPPVQRQADALAGAAIATAYGTQLTLENM